MSAKKAVQRHGFKTGEHVVYPAHGVGQIMNIEEQEIAGFKLELFVVTFDQEKMTLRVPTAKAASVGMRKIVGQHGRRQGARDAQGPARASSAPCGRAARRNMRRRSIPAISSSITEVVRDLYRSDAQPEQSYSERQLYEAASDRLAREIAAVNRASHDETMKLMESFLQKGPRRGPKLAEAELEEAQEEAA